MTYALRIGASAHSLPFFSSIQNIFNQYQHDSDTGPNRASNYIYGPSRPAQSLPALNWECSEELPLKAFLLPMVYL
jgi:hypothetical protein